MQDRFIVVCLFAAVLMVACESQGLRKGGTPDGAVVAESADGAGADAPFTLDSATDVRGTGGAAGSGGTTGSGSGGAGGREALLATGGVAGSDGPATTVGGGMTDGPMPTGGVGGGGVQIPTAGTGAGGAASTKGETGGGGVSGPGSSATGGANPQGTSVPSPEPLWPDLVGKLNLPPCNDGGTRSSPLQLTPQSPIDYIAVCQTTPPSSTRTGANVSYKVIEESGTACSGATDVVACRASLKAVANGMVLSQNCDQLSYTCQNFVVTTAGDTVRRWLPSEYTTLLGPIDTADEARLLANQTTFWGLHVPSCGSIRATADGFDVVGTRLTAVCAPIVYMRDQVHVASDGTVTVVRSNVADASNACF